MKIAARTPFNLSASQAQRTAKSALLLDSQGELVVGAGDLGERRLAGGRDLAETTSAT